MNPAPDSRSEPGPAAGRCSPSVLVVDDEPGVRQLMIRWLRGSGYDVLCAAGGDEALGLLEGTVPGVALCDIRMPGHDGLWLAERIRALHPETAIIMATGVHDVGAAVASLQHGVVDYLMKPFGRDRLWDAVSRGLDWHRTARDARCWRETLEAEAGNRRARLASCIRNQQDVTSGPGVERLLASLTAGEAEARAHAGRVASLAAEVGRAMGLEPVAVATIHQAALLHDIGKLAVPEAILSKPAPLTEDERAIVRRHPQIGADLIAAFPFLAPAADIVRAAQERPDCLGYPQGRAAGAPPLGAQIVAAADAYDTMTRPRAFRDAITPSNALLELDRCSGTQFDPHVVHALKQIVTR